MPITLQKETMDIPFEKPIPAFYRHTEKEIIGFFGPDEVFSNFYPSRIKFGDLWFKDGEALFQARKSLDPKIIAEFCKLSKGAAKRKGRQITLRPDWEEVKDQIMEEVVYAKFSQNEDLKKYLLSTGDAHLEERNMWNDRTWGTDPSGRGQNRLGKALMRVRTRLREESQQK